MNRQIKRLMIRIGLGILVAVILLAIIIAIGYFTAYSKTPDHYEVKFLGSIIYDLTRQDEGYVCNVFSYCR